MIINYLLQLLCFVLGYWLSYNGCWLLKLNHGAHICVRYVEDMYISRRKCMYQSSVLLKLCRHTKVHAYHVQLTIIHEQDVGNDNNSTPPPGVI